MIVTNPDTADSVHVPKPTEVTFPVVRAERRRRKCTDWAIFPQTLTRSRTSVLNLATSGPARCLLPRHTVV